MRRLCVFPTLQRQATVKPLQQFSQACAGQGDLVAQCQEFRIA